MHRSALLVVLACLASLAGARDPDSARARNRALVNEAFARNRARYAGDTNMLVRTGLVANAATREIRIQAEATDIAKGEPVEFFLIGEESGHDYEALAVSFARPGAVHEALVFIGMQPGRRVDYAGLRFWPKGERVLMTVSYEADGKQVGPLRIERLVHDRRTDTTMAEDGLVFTGADYAAGDGQGRTNLYMADIQDPRSVAAAYNEPISVLDVPHMAAQGERYNQQTVHPDNRLPAGALLDIVLVPEHRDGRRRVQDLRLLVAPGQGKDGHPEPVLDLRLLDDRDVVLNREMDLKGVLTAVAALQVAGRDPYVRLLFDESLRLGEMHALCGLLTAVDTGKGMRIEPPEPDDLYYRAYVPDEQMRARENRFAQPCELRLKRQGNSVTGELVRIDEIWRDGKVRPDLKATSVHLDGPQALRMELDKQEAGMPVLLVFADPAITRGELMVFLRPVLATHPTVHVYLAHASGERPSPGGGHRRPDG